MVIKNVCVIGAGVMGNGIAQVSAEAGYSVTMTDIKDEFLSRGMATIERNLDRKIKKGTIQESDKVATLDRIKTTLDINDARDADMVVEAALEELEIKKNIFKQLAEICNESAVLGTNTSSLPIGAIATATKRPEKVIGIHFMNPVPMMKGVELIPGRHTDPDVLEASKEYIKSLDKEPCEARDYAGFIVSRLVDALINEAILCVMDGNKPEEVDKAVKLCLNHPMGPLELCDLAGADIVLHGLDTMYAEFGERLRPAPLLKNIVRSGDYGRKTGRGFYDYTRQ